MASIDLAENEDASANVVVGAAESFPEQAEQVGPLPSPPRARPWKRGTRPLSRRAFLHSPVARCCSSSSGEGGGSGRGGGGAVWGKKPPLWG